MEGFTQKRTLIHTPVHLPMCLGAPHVYAETQSDMERACETVQDQTLDPGAVRHKKYNLLCCHAV